MSEEKYKDIIKEMESLPQGGITYKKINGKEYAYYQWREDGKQRSRRAKDEELENLMAQIKRRKELENQLKEAGISYKAKTAKPRKTPEKKTKPADKAAKTTKEQAKTKSKPAAKAARKTEQPAGMKIETRWLADETRKAERTTLYQPGESHQAEELIAFLLEDEFFDCMTPSQKEAAEAALTARMAAIMLEDRVHMETKAANPDCQVFRLHMEDGTFDMVVVNTKEGSCQLYEIKHCSELSRAHCEYLLNEASCEAVATRFGQVTEKFVLYNGKTINVMEAGTSGTLQNVKYMNVEKYLEEVK